MKKSAHLGVLVGFVLSGAILIYLLAQLEWGVFVAELGKLNIVWLPLLVLTFAGSNWIRAIRWQYLLPSDVNLSTMKLFSGVNLGTLATCVLPLRAGEFIRPWVISRSKQVTFPCAFSSVVTERVFDILAMLTLFIVTLGGIDNPPPWAIICAKALGGIAAAVLALMLVAYFQGDFTRRLAASVIDFFLKSKAPRLAAKLIEIANEFVSGLSAISSFKELLLIIFWSYALWLTMSGFYYMGILAFGSDLGFTAANAVNVCIALAVAAPSAPGFIGTFQIGCLAALNQIYGESSEFALAYSVVLHGVQMITAIFLGFWMLHFEGMTFSQLRTREQPASA